MTRKPETITFWRGRLPHWEVADGRYFVTIHLAGAIPQQGRERIHQLAREHEQLKQESDSWLAIQRRIYAEMEAWLDRAEYVTHLAEPSVVEMVTEAIVYRHGRDWNMLQYVVMPSHVHLFFELVKPGLQTCLEQFKRWTGHQAAKLIGGDESRFWQDEWFDHWSRSDEEDDRIVEYIQQNPVKAKLVKRYLEWPYGMWNSPLANPS